VKIIKTIPLVARGSSLVESCHAKWRHCITVQWLTASATGMQTVAPLGTSLFIIIIIIIIKCSTVLHCNDCD